MSVGLNLDLAQSIIIQQATEKDLTKVKIFMTGMFPFRYPAKFYRQLVKDSPEKCLMAHWNEKLVGVICFRCEMAAETEGKRVNILVLGVLPTYQRLGIGSLLLERVKELFLDCRFYLHVQCSNVKAIQFYEKHSFHLVERVINYYSSMEKDRDAFLLEFIPTSHLT
jgi:ribosomal protein S18 acetylase RimI-like enzyme